MSPSLPQPDPPGPPGPPAGRAGLVWFAAMSSIWGLTWIPIKIGVAVIPPEVFAGTRGVAAGSLLLAIVRWRGSKSSRWAPAREHRARLFGVACTAFAANYWLLFWGVQWIDSGQAAVVNLASVPMFLLLVGVAAGEERLSGRKLVSTCLGITGLAVLHAAELSAPSGPDALVGLAAVVAASLTYAIGSVGSRELLRHYSPFVVAGWTQLSGGLLLLVLAAVREPAGFEALSALATLPVFASWSFLVVFGSIIAFSGYLKLTHLWSPHRAGLYAFVSPCIAVAVGAIALGERTTPSQLGGMALMLAATLLALGRGKR